MDASNPYDAPQAQVYERPEALDVVPAGRWRRFFNFLIDYCCFVLLIVVVAVITALAGGEELLAELDQPNFLRDYALGVCFMLAYYVPMEGMFGLTVGKLVTGTRVVNERGEPPSWGQVLGRSLCRFIPFEPLSMFSSQRRGWHDLIPKTFVVRKHRRVPTVQPR
jgi:uncharacterized RDD family membrane protein YckC